MGPLLSDLAQKMQAKAEKGDDDPTKILIHSTHDTCLAGLSSTLDMFDEKYAFELTYSYLGSENSFQPQMARVHGRHYV